MKKQPSLIQKIISPRATYHARAESPKDPTLKGFSSPKSATGSERGRSARYNKALDERDDISSHSPGARARRDDGRFGSDMLRESNEKISSLFDIKWMYEKKEDEEETQRQEATEQDTTTISDNGAGAGAGAENKPNKTVSFIRRKGLGKAESSQKDDKPNTIQKDKKRIWKRKSSLNQSQTKSSTRSLTGIGKDPENQSETKSSKRSFFKRKEKLSSNRSMVCEEEEQQAGQTKDCADWLMNGLCGNNKVEEEKKLSTETKQKQKRKWSLRLNRKRNKGKNA